MRCHAAAAPPPPSSSSSFSSSFILVGRIKKQHLGVKLAPRWYDLSTHEVGMRPDDIPFPADLTFMWTSVEPEEE